MTRPKDPIKELLRDLFQQAPATLHHVFALDGANEALALLSTAESKVAYLLQLIALELHKASKEIDPSNVSTEPNDIKFHILRTDKFFTSASINVTIFELAEFEDLYYATCAKLKELLHVVDIHLANGFKNPNDTYFVYHSPRLDTIDPIRVGDFKASLLIYESILYSTKLVELINDGIMKKSMRDKLYDSYQQLDCTSGAIHNNIEYVDAVHHDIQRRTVEDLQQNLGWLKGIDGLQDPGNMSCSMIYATLAEKYRSTVLGTRSLGAAIRRETTPDVPQARQEASYHHTYINPYNLEERAKKLNIPGGPEMPCICDPDCMCTPVCASDPTQNCLCEENGLFARVTQGMDIDDLDVPDLVRHGRASSEISGSSVVSLLESIRSCPEPSMDEAQFTPIIDTFDDECISAADEGEQRNDQQRRLLTSPETNNMTPINGILASPEIDEYDLWESHCMIPPRVSSLSYRDYCELLRQPCAKLCDHPPKRASMAQRLFSSRNHSVTTSKKASSGNAEKVFKQGNKRSLPSKSFTGPKFSLRRD